ncbi:ABC transporter substrate-binding protein [Streptomyces yaizuensis]|uniref:ABC transporter substrate-binding protein n=1 Tax=Streptomyces yaizuensis TaxID=2989713 RepID=A0ABQ5P3B1_9ACTN|nr:ABC transporter substrate-binding protein [Streptomyces sp. YSPA8]GLF96938.1 ABC transporter substrate-binding protein [Streptomyces sp. YSPA8]
MALLATLLATGCGSGDEGATTSDGVPLVAKGRLTTCTHLPYPPFQFERDGEVVGFDVALIDRVAKNLGVEQHIVDTPFENFKTGAFLNSGQCDLAAAGMTITDERRKNVDFSIPYFDATQALLATADSEVTTLAEVRSGKKRLGAQSGTTGESHAQEQGFDPVAFESADAVLNGLRTRQVDAVVIDYPVVQGWLKDPANARTFRLGRSIDTGERYGFSVKKGNDKLRAAIDQVIEESRADGGYERLHREWIGPLPKGSG